MIWEKNYIKDIVALSIEGELVNAISDKGILETVQVELDIKYKKFIIDLQNVNYINSAGINLLLAVFTKIRNSEGELVLSSLSTKVNNLLVITKLNSIFNIRKTITDSILFFKDMEEVESTTL